MKADARLIVALDFPTLALAKETVLRLGDSVSYYKVGMELYYAAGNAILQFLQQQHKQVFLDLKLQDIPNTVASALKVLSQNGISMVNVHAVGGLKMMKAAADALADAAKENGSPRPRLLAVTILTSMDKEQFEALNYKNTLAEQVVALAQLAQKAGCDGVVASPLEAVAIRKACGPDFLIVTPGVRPAGADVQDQKRVATPAAAIKNGATHIVVGRPITKAKDQVAAAQAICREMADV